VSRIKFIQILKIRVLTHKREVKETIKGNLLLKNGKGQSPVPCHQNY